MEKETENVTNNKSIIDITSFNNTKGRILFIQKESLLG